MSIVAAKIYKDRIVIGADSQSTSYWHNKNETNKIYKVANDFIIGGVGYTAHNQLMRLYCETDKPASARERDILEFFVKYHEWIKTKVKDYAPVNSWIIAFRGECFGVTSDLLIVKVKNFHAIGSGMEYARAALHLGHSVRDAISVACDLTVFCGRPIEMFTMKKK